MEFRSLSVNGMVESTLNKSIQIVALLLSAVLAGSAYGATELRAVRCGTDQVVVTTDRRADADSACKGAKRAIEFLKSVGLKTEVPIKIRLVPRPDLGVSEYAVGCYDAALNEVRLLNFADCRTLLKNSPSFGQPFDREMFEAFVSHEVGHAIVAANSLPRNLPRLTHEYIAYVTQFASMPASLKRRILVHYGRISAGDRYTLRSGALLMRPNVFGVRCYKHFLLPGNGVQFVRQLVRGEKRLLDSTGSLSGVTPAER